MGSRETIRRRPASLYSLYDAVEVPDLRGTRCRGTCGRTENSKKPIVRRDAEVVASVTQRGQPPFQKRFKGTDIDWSVAEDQLLKWENWIRAGKKIKIDVTLNFVGSPQVSGGSPSKKGNKRSATQCQLAVQAMQLNAEGELGRVWKDVFALFRCEDKFCNLHNYCWCDPVTKKHYKLSPFDMTDLVEFAQKGSTLKTHDDSPITCGMHCAEQNDRNRVGGKQARPTDYQEILRMHRYQLHKWPLGLLSRCRRQAWRALLVSRVVVMMQ